MDSIKEMLDSMKERLDSMKGRLDCDQERVNRVWTAGEAVKHSLPAYGAMTTALPSAINSLLPTINYCRCNMKKLCVEIFLFATGVFDNGDQPRVVNIFASL